MRKLANTKQQVPDALLLNNLMAKLATETLQGLCTSLKDSLDIFFNGWPDE